jgi:DNA-binding MarR family transcriptional regulator
VQYKKRPFEALEGTSCNITVLWLIGKAGAINISDLCYSRYAGSNSIYRAVDSLIAAGLVERTLGEHSSKPLKLTAKGNLLYNSCILKALELLPDNSDSR